MTKKTRWLLQTLILSGVLNVVFLALFFYFLIRDNPLHFAFQPKEEIKQETASLNPAFLGQLQALSFDLLIELLSDQRMVEQGYRVCDFAVGALATFHDFDVQRALGRRCLPRRKWEFDETSFILFPGLSEADFATLAVFAQTERFPFTTKGLVQRMDLQDRDPDLLNYFCRTPQFVLLERLFARTGLPITKGTLLKLVQEGGWERLCAFYDEQEQCSDLSDKTRQKLLTDYMEGGAKTAAYLLLITDSEFALKHLTDGHVAQMLELLDVKTQEATRFAREVATSPRSDTVRERAFRRLAEYCGDEVAGRYVPRPGEGELRPVFRESPPAAPEPSTHVIQPGESLWLIAQKYNISIERLMEINQLHSTTIRPGKTLKIP